MNATNRWRNRLLRLRDAGSQWFALRTKDVAWLLQQQAFERQLKRLREEHLWVFVVGCNNSGTTLIHDVLAATGEFSFMPHEGQRYTSALRHAAKRGHERVWTEYLEELRLDETHSLSAGGRLWFDWLHELQHPVKPRILEKTTANAVRMRWLQRVFPRSAFIGVVRDGHAVVEGIKRKGKKPVMRGARHWSLVNEIMLRDAKFVERFLLVRYEDFVGSPRHILPKLAEFLDLRPEQLEQAFASIDRNPTASSRGAIQNMNSSSVGRLSPEELRTIAAEAGRTLSALGYVP